MLGKGAGVVVCWVSGNAGNVVIMMPGGLVLSVRVCPHGRS
jgi:hypothetical protein